MDLYRSCEAMLLQAEYQEKQSPGSGDTLHHNWLCHPNGEACPDGCDIRPDPKRVRVYNTFSR